jgi:Domain of unknown function DUF29
MTTSTRRLPALYDADYVAWSIQQADLLQQHRFNELDLENLIDEVLDLGNRHRDALESNLIILLTHLLKWQYQPELRSSSWRGSIVEHRRRINKALAKYPSLRPYFATIFDECFQDALEQAVAETDLAASKFPQQSPYGQQDILDATFFPNL